MSARRHVKESPSLLKALKKKGQQLAVALEAGQRRATALDLRKRGCSYREIGAALQVNTLTARKYVVDAIHEARGLEDEDAVLVRDLEIERLDTILGALWPKVLKGDTFSIQQALKVMERRSAYLGLDAPNRTEFLGAIATLTPDTVTKLSDEELAQRTQDLLLRLTGRQKAPEPEK